MIVHTSDHTDGFYTAWVQMAQQVEADPMDLACVAFSESGLHAGAANDGPIGLPEDDQYHASGLIQFMAPTLKGLGWTYGYKAFRHMSAEAQVAYVQKYFAPHRGKLRSKALAYVTTFVPAYLDAAAAGGPDYVLVQKDGRLGWAYAANARAFDADKDYKITVQELENAIARNCVGPRWNEASARMRKAMGLPEDVPPTDRGVLDLRTVLGVQRALHLIGLDTGPLDGVAGPRTRRAVAAFQADTNGLAVDGIVGPKTRAALEQAASRRLA